MRLEVDCTWSDKKEKGKLSICFDPLPKTLFSMPSEQIFRLQKWMINPKEHFEEIKKMQKTYSKSLYAACAYYNTLKITKQNKIADSLLENMREKYGDQPFFLCIEAGELLEQRRFDEFYQKFCGVDVLKGAFKKRRLYYFEEALFFHTLWAKYYREEGNLTKYQKHQQFLALIHNTLQSKKLF